MGERDMEVDFSPFQSPLHLLADTAESVHKGELGLPGELPRIFSDEVLGMGGQEVLLVLEKTLWTSDVDPNQSRLSIPKLGIQANFLTTEEIRTLDNKEGITVSLLDPRLQVRDGLQLKKWNYKGETFSYVLTKQWNALVHGNRLKEGSRIQLWSFRVNGNLHFCLVNIGTARATVEDMATHE